MCHILKESWNWSSIPGCLEPPDVLQINTVTQQTKQQTSEIPEPNCQHWKKPGPYQNQCRQLKREQDPTQNNPYFAGNSNNNNNGGQTSTKYFQYHHRKQYKYSKWQTN